MSAADPSSSTPASSSDTQAPDSSAPNSSVPDTETVKASAPAEHEPDLFRGSSEASGGWEEFVVGGVDTRPRRWVVVHNDFVLARVDWDINMNRIFAMLVSQIAMDAEEFQLQRIRVRDLRDLAQVSSNALHKELADAAQRLIREPIEFRSEDHKYEGYSIFSICRYLPSEGVIEAKFNEDARPYLLQLRESFTRYKLQQVMKLSTPYAVRFYQIAKMIQRDEGPRTRMLGVPEFRSLFMLENKYDRHADLVNHVIKPSVGEVNDKTKTRLRVDTARKGGSKYGSPVGLRWTVWPSADPVIDRPDPGSDRDAREGPAREDDAPTKFERWYSQLPEDEQKEWWKKARALLIDEGRDPSAPGFDSYVQMKLRDITEEERTSDKPQSEAQA
jgi:hypothetical protein